MRNVCSGNAESGFHCDVQPCWTEDKMQFAGESIVIHPGGEVIVKVNDQDTEYYYYGEEINGDYI